MPTDQATLFEADDPDRDEYERLRGILHSLTAQFAEEEDVPSGMLALLLLDLGVMHRQLEYVLSVERPSASGLKLDLDRFGREIDDFLRGTKKGADQFVANAKEALAEAAAAAASRPPDVAEDIRADRGGNRR